jgi:hypothetical protein
LTWPPAQAWPLVAAQPAMLAGIGTPAALSCRPCDAGRCPQGQPVVTGLLGLVRWGNPRLEQKAPLRSNSCVNPATSIAAARPSAALWITVLHRPGRPTMRPLSEQLVHNEPRPLATRLRAARD